MRADRLDRPAHLARGTRAICRREDAHPGAQLRFSDHDGHRFQVFLTDQPDGDLAGLELRHRQRARVEDRIRAAKATGLANLPFDRWRRNAVWLELVLAAQDLTCWTQALLLDGALAVAEPKTLWTSPRRQDTSDEEDVRMEEREQTGDRRRVHRGVQARRGGAGPHHRPTDRARSPGSWGSMTPRWATGSDRTASTVASRGADQRGAGPAGGAGARERPAADGA